MSEIQYARELNPREAVVLKKNKSCFFILPFLGHPSYWYYGLINTYLGDETNKPEFNLNKIFVQVKVYDNKLTDIPYFNQFYRLEDNTYMYVYNIPSKYQDDYTKFYQGKYSQMSENAKELICKLSGIKPIINSDVFRILYKTAEQRYKVEQSIGQKLPDDAELYSIPDMELEIYNSPLEILKERGEIKTLREENSAREKVL